MTSIACSNCRSPYPPEGVPYRCPQCGGVYDFSGLPKYDPQREDARLPGLWRYRYAFPLLDDAPVVTLGEGDTPLVWDTVGGRRIAFKLEMLNPTGSFKDRLSAVAASFLLSRGVSGVIEDSSGNAGASLAGYAARAGIRARIFVPAYASGPKRAQIEAYGAELVPVEGPRSAAAEAVQREAEAGAIYASHAYLPHGMAGLATIAYELYEQIGAAPGTVIAPAGHGSLLLGIMRGFAALQAAGRIQAPPVYVGVQARACAPIWTVFSTGSLGLGRLVEGQTLAEGVRVHHPLRGDAILRAFTPGRDLFAAVEEEEILPARDELARRGFSVEPTSAIVWAAASHLWDRLPEPIVLILSGSGTKYRDHS